MLSQDPENLFEPREETILLQDLNNSNLQWCIRIRILELISSILCLTLAITIVINFEVYTVVAIAMGIACTMFVIIPIFDLIGYYNKAPIPCQTTWLLFATIGLLMYFTVAGILRVQHFVITKEQTNTQIPNNEVTFSENKNNKIILKDLTVTAFLTTATIFFFEVCRIIRVLDKLIERKSTHKRKIVPHQSLRITTSVQTSETIFSYDRPCTPCQKIVDQEKLSIPISLEEPQNKDKILQEEANIKEKEIKQLMQEPILVKPVAKPEKKCSKCDCCQHSISSTSQNTTPKTYRIENVQKTSSVISVTSKNILVAPEIKDRTIQVEEIAEYRSGTSEYTNISGMTSPREANMQTMPIIEELHLAKDQFDSISENESISNKMAEEETLHYSSLQDSPKLNYSDDIICKCLNQSPSDEAICYYCKRIKREWFERERQRCTPHIPQSCEEDQVIDSLQQEHEITPSPRQIVIKKPAPYFHQHYSSKSDSSDSSKKQIKYKSIEVSCPIRKKVAISARTELDTIDCTCRDRHKTSGGLIFCKKHGVRKAHISVPGSANLSCSQDKDNTRIPLQRKQNDTTINISDFEKLTAQVAANAVYKDFDCACKDLVRTPNLSYCKVHGLRIKYFVDSTSSKNVIENIESQRKDKDDPNMPGTSKTPD